VNNNCVQNVSFSNNGVVTSYCYRVANQSLPAIYNICNAQDLALKNFTTGLGQCVIQFAASANTSAHNYYQDWQNQINQTNIAIRNNTALKQELDFGTNITNIILDVVAIGVIIVSLFIAGFLYLRRRNKYIPSRRSSSREKR
jgi:hypothetical protein